MSATDRIVIVGAGLGGVQTAVELRELGAEQEILLLTDEAMAYDRPPLSKEMLAGEARPAGLELLSATEADRRRIALRTGAKVVAIDRKARTVRLESGESIAYGRLVLATGGAASSLPALAPDRERVFVIRDLDDADALAKALVAGRRLLVVGAGWLGLEVAAAAAAKGLVVTLVEQAPRVCSRSIPAEVSDYLEAAQQSLGVEVRTNARNRISLAEDGVSLAGPGGVSERYDLCVLAVGMAPRIELAQEAGLACRDGVEADARGRTSDADIYAVGDAAAWWSPLEGRHRRQESWHSAKMQGRIVAADILGREPPVEAPWFWSDHGGQLLQAAGTLTAEDRLITAEAGVAPLWRYGAGDTVAFVVGVNRPRDVRMAHRNLSAEARERSAAGKIPEIIG